MHIVIAMDKFAGTLTAPEAVRAVTAGWLRSSPEDEVTGVPMSDGGPGFLDSMSDAFGGRVQFTEQLATVTGPLGTEVTGRYLIESGHGSTDGKHPTAYIEVAEACGLHLVPADQRDAKAATTYGVGELIAAALADGAKRLVIGLGGTSTTDGGAGLLAALGAEPAEVLRAGGGALKSLHGLDLTEPRRRLADIETVIASDVDNPLLGLRGAAAVFGPQKGATDDDVQRLDAALTHFAELAGAIGQEPGAIRRTLDAPGAGAGGGLGYGLMLLGGRRVPGIGTVIAETGLADLIAGADLVITGEGRFDHSSLGGKVPTGVAEAALASGRPCIVLAGLVEVGKRELAAAGFAAAYEVAEQAGSAQEAMARAEFHLAALAERVARSWSRG
ncbi:glycerate kinase [Catenulispora sp. NF23]|uniref:Glycerate kinase n=1 Tax=Catenulispora pinistramenti TaxID=2705254 RepID=A0ABS5KUQ1_9ACTN|nr:glycerate kinase [Catenulispora pinistramenti]MBS2534149.1 glycerate kinase [Catenulispora pinistramenti]MBS2549770.1 glycerate kinase [Catenulispora pinistramenti]